MQKETLMEQEARQAPAIIAKQISRTRKTLISLSKRVKKNKPAFVLTIARGSSDHAATFAKYLIETRLGLVTSSAAPSVVTLYNAKLNLKNALVIGLSQSGESPDICEVMAYARETGAVTAAFVNNPESHLAKKSEYIIPLYAAPEKAVAATKSYIATLAGILHMTAICSADSKLTSDLLKLPSSLEKALSMNWSPAIKLLKGVKDTLVIARGYCFPIAQEAALKFKETSSLHAEAFSGAEIMHGPFALIKRGYPVLVFAEDDKSLEGVVNLSKKIKALGGKIILSCPKNILPKKKLNDIASLVLPMPESVHRLCDPLMIIQAFYPMVARLAVSRGYDPDAPKNLKKITETV